MDSLGFFGFYDRVVTIAAKAMADFPEEKLDWRPAPGTPTAGELMGHISGGEEFFTRGLGQNDWTRPEHAPPAPDHPVTPASLAQRLEEAHRKMKEALAGLPPQEYAAIKETPFTGPIPLQMLLYGMLEHLIHHRAQLYTYYRLLGKEPPSMYGRK